MNIQLVHKLDDQDFDEKVIKTKKLILVDFWADWCGPCKILSPILNEVAKEYCKKIIFYKINIDDNPLTAPKYNVSSIPTLILFKNGKIVDTKSGILSLNQIKNFLNKYIV